LTDIFDKIKNSEIPLVMGILNVTPDSFSDGGKFNKPESAFIHAETMIKEGADIIDVGGESTRPGADLISAEEEKGRVLPVIKKVKDEYPEAVISIDTTKSEVAGAAAEAGASIINDISGGNFDVNMYSTAASLNLPFVIMHIKGTPKDMQNSPYYGNVIDEINIYFRETIKSALNEKVEKIILDPGIGFGKRIEDNFAIIANLREFKIWNLPLMIGVSRKSFLGKSLGLEVGQRDNSTIITETASVINGADILRTHNVKNAIELKKIIENLNKSSAPRYV
jgi:dihydropteroate synthase